MSNDASSTTNLPRGTRLAAWSWIVLGVLTALIALLGSLLVEAAQHMMAAGEMPGMPKMRHEGIDAGSGIVLALHYVYAAVAIAGGIKLLQLRPWARSLLEGLTWVSLVLVAALAVVWVVLWNSITMKMIPAGSPTGLLWAVGLGADAILTAIGAIPLWKMLRFLRGEALREAIRRANPG